MRKCRLIIKIDLRQADKAGFHFHVYRWIGP